MIGATQLVECLSEFGRLYSKILGKFLLIQHGNRFPFPVSSAM